MTAERRRSLLRQALGLNRGKEHRKSYTVNIGTEVSFELQELERQGLVAHVGDAGLTYRVTERGRRFARGRLRDHQRYEEYLRFTDVYPNTSFRAFLTFHGYALPEETVRARRELARQGHTYLEYA